MVLPVPALRPQVDDVDCMLALIQHAYRLQQVCCMFRTSAPTSCSRKIDIGIIAQCLRVCCYQEPSITMIQLGPVTLNIYHACCDLVWPTLKDGCRQIDASKPNLNFLPRRPGTYRACHCSNAIQSHNRQRKLAVLT